LWHLHIAGVHFLISLEISHSLQDLEPAHQSFFAKATNHFGTHSADIRIRLRLGEIPPTEKLKKLFNSEQSWSMFQDGHNHSLTLNSPAFEQPHWFADINSDFTKVTVCLNEKFVSQKNDKTVLSNPIKYPLLQILLMYILAQRQGAIIHAAGIVINGKGYIFPGKSGAGKSTMTRQFAGRRGIGLLSDDRVVVRKEEGAFRAYGTPWPGEEGIAENMNVPLSGLFFIAHGSENRIKEISAQEALERLLPVTSIPWYDRDVVPKMLDFCGDLVSHIPTYEFQFKPGIEVVDVLEEYVSK